MSFVGRHAGLVDLRSGLKLMQAACCLSKLGRGLRKENDVLLVFALLSATELVFGEFRRRGMRCGRAAYLVQLRHSGSSMLHFRFLLLQTAQAKVEYCG